MQFSLSNSVSAPSVPLNYQLVSVSANHDSGITVSSNFLWSDHYNKICHLHMPHKTDQIYYHLNFYKHQEEVLYLSFEKPSIVLFAALEAMSGKGYEQPRRSTKESHEVHIE